MMAVRERAVKVMASLDRRVPSLDEFVGQSWSTWTERAGVTAADGEQTHGRQQRWSPDRLMKALRYVFVQMERRANHVTQTKTLPGPSAGWVTCFALPGRSLNAVFNIKPAFIAKCCRVGVCGEAVITDPQPAFHLMVEETAACASERKGATSYR